MGLDDGWGPNRWQAFIQTSDALVYWQKLSLVGVRLMQWNALPNLVLFWFVLYCPKQTTPTHDSICIYFWKKYFTEWSHFLQYAVIMIGQVDVNAPWKMPTSQKMYFYSSIWYLGTLGNQKWQSLKANAISKSHMCFSLNSSRPTDSNVCHKTKPSLVQIMACYLFGTKPLSQPMLVYCWFGPFGTNIPKFESKHNNLHFVLASLC